jgi:adenosylcobinamide-GDP ribazoletransferase
MRWWIPPLLAVQFLTRIPVPGLNALSADTVKTGLAKSVIWFPLVGALVGITTALAVLSFDQILPRAIAVIIALIIEARLTGAFHEDAVADFCDGFGGGQTSERILEIMKDSRIGSYGTLGLLLAVGLRAACMAGLPTGILIPAIIAAAAAGRWGAVLAMALIPPVQQGTGIAKDIGTQVGGTGLLWASLLLLPAIAALGLAAPLVVASALAVQLLAVIWFRALLLQSLGGVSGDCLGFFVYLSQLIWLLAALAWAS